LGYFLRGVLEAHRFEPEGALLAAALRTARAIRGAFREDGRLPGRLDQHLNGTVDWICLTGSVQIAHCFLLLHQTTGDPDWLDAACALNCVVRRTVRTEGPRETVGAVKGSFPVWGAYGRYQYLNWAAKFFIDANLCEAAARAKE
jgi:hypothetical protein